MNSKLNGNFYLGWTDIETEGRFVSFRGQKVNDLFSLTLNNHMYLEHVISVIPTQNYFLGDAYYVHGLKYMCTKVFSELTKWVEAEVVFESETNTTVRENRTCINSTLGEPPGCVGPMERYRSYTLLDTPMDFPAAKLACSELPGGRLFDDLRGSSEQVALLAKRANYSSFWLGITLYVQPHIYWVNMQSQHIESLSTSPYILWAANNPSVPSSQLAVAAVDTDRLIANPTLKVLESLDYSTVLKPLCLQEW